MADYFPFIVNGFFVLQAFVLCVAAYVRHDSGLALYGLFPLGFNLIVTATIGTSFIVDTYGSTNQFYPWSLMMLFSGILLLIDFGVAWEIAVSKRK